MMAINLRNQSPSKINLTPCQMKDQFNTYKDKYNKVHTKSISTGFGLTNEDQKGGSVQSIRSLMADKVHGGWNLTVVPLAV
ncbi:hypothetical protein VP01_376g8 [Puccinia sorghi]|uniref:Uncharacterized protein n=1 Tax=Puccinia sorghi TaxID=27349 RepID=A0A0L6UUJ7_9BASI|nr:hypothetical protein VP01_376g8 [Puccinia sorghi]